MTKAEVTLPAAVSSVPTARHFIESILSGWGLRDLAWTATLLISELAANAALHARGDSFTIRVSTQEDGIRLEVQDGSLRLPQQRSYSDEATTGRGLRLVGELADDWGVTPVAGGKTVWAVLRDEQVSGGAEDEVDVEALLEAFGDDDEAGSVTDLSRRPTALFDELAVAA